MRATLRDIKSAACIAFRIKPEILKGPRGTRAVTGPRQMTMFLMREFTGASFPAIARHLGRTNHTTAIYAVRQVRRRLAESPEHFTPYLSKVLGVLANSITTKERIRSLAQRGFQ